MYPTLPGMGRPGNCAWESISKSALLPFRLWGIAATIAIVVLCGMIGTSAPADDAAIPLEKEILAGQELLYHGHFDEALNHFTALSTAFPQDPKPSFFLALTYRWLTRIDPESKSFQEYFEQTARNTIALAQTILQKEPRNGEVLLYIGAMYGYRAEYWYFLKNRWNSAYNDGIRMREYLDKVNDVPPLYTIDVQLGYGLYNYYADVYRKKIGWWKFLTSIPKGDKEQGIAQILKVRDQGTYLQVEAGYFLAEIYKRDDDYRDRAIPLCETLQATYPNHPYFHIFLAGLYHTRQDWRNSRQTAQAILAQAHTSPYYSNYIVYQAKYLIGESSFYLGDHQTALQYFDDIIAAHPSNPDYLLPWSHLRRGTIYNLTERKADAVSEYQQVLKLDDILNVHDLARAFLKNTQQ